MKKVLVAMLAVVLSIAMIGCSGTPTPTVNPTEAPTQQPTQTINTVEEAAMSYFADFTANPVIKPADLFAMMSENPFIVDIRQQDVYDQGHLKGAYLASWGADLAEKVSMLPMDKPVYVYCYTGQTAGQTVALLRMLGIDAYSVQSGYTNGIAKTEGYDAYIETAANELPDAGASFDADVLSFVQNYFNEVADNGNFQIAAADAEPLIADGSVTFVDVRQAADYDAGHVEGAINIPFVQGMQEQFAQLPMDQQIIVACYTGQTAGQTTAILRALGYDAVSLKGGMNNGWAPFVTTTAATAYFANFEANPVIKSADLFAKMDAGETPFIVDIRKQDVYDQGHLKGAYLASWGADLAEKTAMLPTDKPVYVYCYTGQTAGQTVALLRMLGVDAYSVQSGYTNGISQTEGFEAYLETTANELPDAGATFDPFLMAKVAAYFNSVTDNGNFQIAAADAQALVEAGTVTFVDVRRAEDFAAGHVAGAVNIPFEKGMQEQFSTLPKDQQIIVTCYTGQTAGQTIAVLRMLGYDALSLKGGMNNGWTAAELPVVTE